MLLLIQLDACHGKPASQKDQPQGNQQEPIDGRVPKGNLSERTESFQTHDFCDKVQETHQCHKETQRIPARTKRRRVDISAPPLDADVNQSENDKENDPFKRINETNQTVGDNVGNFQGSPSNLIVAGVRDPVVQVELRGQQFGRHGRSNVQESTDPLREGPGHGQHANGNVQRDPLGAALTQNPRQLNHGEHEKEPRQGVDDSGRQVLGAVLYAKIPLLLDVLWVESHVRLVIEMRSIEFSHVIRDQQGIARHEQQGRQDAHKIHHGKMQCTVLCVL
mmetsp:Transcript_24131/g.42394  ORF Transcript_24131/g.42394 Transcript_24131/m.42394 type:complete len:278 (-) Transcript_24131:13-846(-)